MSEPSHPAGRDPNYILSQDEFHTSLDVWGNQLFGAMQAHGSEATRQFDGLRLTAGWVAISLACWLLMVGFVMLSKAERGRP